MKNILCLVGRTCSGKTTLAKELNKQFGWKIINSYTTREPRYEGEEGHIFVGKSELRMQTCEGTEILAYTFYNQNHYWTTHDQLEQGINVYVIDPAGLYEMKKRFGNRYNIISVFINTPRDVCIGRAIKRDGEDKAVERAIHDDEIYEAIYDIDYVLDSWEADTHNLASVIHQDIVFPSIVVQEI